MVLCFFMWPESMLWTVWQSRVHILYRLAPRRWLRDVQHVSLDYLRSSQQRYSLTQIVWNIYMAARPHCFIQLNQGCNFQPCAARTNVQMQDIPDRYPTIIIVHLWRACLKHKGTENDFFVSYYNTLTYLPLAMINRINPTNLSRGLEGNVNAVIRPTKWRLALFFHHRSYYFEQIWCRIEKYYFAQKEQNTMGFKFVE